MTIDEAIIHCEEVATQKLKNENNAKCVQCGEEHVQLAKWLKELKDYKSREDVVPVVRKPVKEYEGYYEVDNFGRVFSLDRNVTVNDNGRIYEKPIKGKQMKQGVHTQGYKVVSLTKDGKTRTNFVHRIVAEAFIPNPDELPMVNHKDEDKTNNFVDNLEWCTNEYNINYGTAIKRASQKKKGKKHAEEHKQKIANSLKHYYTTHNSPTKGKPSPNRRAVISIDENGNESFYDSVDDAVKAIGVHDSRNILAVCRGDRKTAYGRRWRYADGFCDKGERKE